MTDLVHRLMISSTWFDLKDERFVVRDACLMSDLHPDMMEYDSTKPDQGILESSYAKVDRAHAYLVLISDWRYGQILNVAENTDGLSVTELEFRRAEGRGIPICVFLRADDAPLNGTKQQVQAEAVNNVKLEAFRAHARRHIRITDTFTDAADLKPKVVAALTRLNRLLSSVPKEAPGDLIESVIWKHEEGSSFDSMIDFRMHPPTRIGNSNNFEVQGSLIIGEITRLVDDARYSAVLLDATLQILKTSFQISPGGLLGSIHLPNDNFETSALGARIVGPRQFRRLFGTALDGQCMAIVEPYVENSGPLTAQILANQWDIDIRTEIELTGGFSIPNLSVNKEKLMKIMHLQDVPRDDGGRLVISRARMRMEEK